jgi:chromosome segregation ATPase
MTTKKMRAAWWWPMFRNALIFDTVDLINAYIRENRANVSMMSLDGTVIRASQADASDIVQATTCSTASWTRSASRLTRR